MKQNTKQKMGKSFIAITVLFQVALLVWVKYVFIRLGFEPLALNPLVGAIFTGFTFITGYVLNSLLTDYKLAETIPAQLRSSLTSFIDEARAVYEKDKSFDLQKVKEIVINFIDEFEEGLSDEHNHSHMDHSLNAIDKLEVIYPQLEQRNVPANYIVRLKQEQAKIRELVLRVYQIQKTKFVPSLKVLVQSMVVFVLCLLLLLKQDVLIGLVLVGIFSYLLLYITNILTIIEKPFRKGDDDTCDDVSIFLLREYRDY